MPLHYTPEQLLRFGVYAIVNEKAGSAYIGSTAQSFSARFKQNYYVLVRGLHSNQELQEKWIKQGSDAFTFVILEAAADARRVRNREAYWMQVYREQGYVLFNEREVVGIHSPHQRKPRMASHFLTDEQKERIRRAYHEDRISVKILVSRFGVSRALVYRIIRGAP